MNNLRELLSLLGENRHLQAAVVILGSLVAAWIVDRVLTKGIARLARQTRTDIDDRFIAALHKPIFHTFLLFGLGAAIKIERLPYPFEFIAFGAIKSLVILIWLFLAARLSVMIFRWMAQDRERFSAVQPETLPVFEIGAKVLLALAAGYLLIISWNIDATGWLASAGIAGIAVGFAAKDTLSNLFAGIFILADAPYKIGDFIELDGQRGQVTKIGLRSTRILTRDDIEITVPNAAIAASKIVNESGGPSVKHRLRIAVGVAYGSDVDRVREVLQGVADAGTMICREPEPRVRFRRFGESALDFELLCWIDDPQKRGMVLDALNTGIYKALGAAGIEIPFPQRDIHIRSQSGD